MLDILLPRTSLHFTQIHFTPLHYTCRHFTSSHVNFTQLHFTAPSLGLNPFEFHLTSLHFTCLHFMQFSRFSPLFYSFHFTPLIIAFLTLFLKILGLQGKVPNVSPGRWFQFLNFWRRNYFLNFGKSCI